jgi:plastocyanin
MNAMVSRAVLAALLAVLSLGGCDRAGGPLEEASDTELVDRLTTAPRGVNVHLVRMVHRGDAYTFEPDEIEVRSGDLVRFVMDSPQPESVAFGMDGLSPEAAEFVRQHDLASGVLLTSAGEVYDVSFRDAPPGRYPFRSIVHAERGMTGAVVVGD